MYKQLEIDFSEWKPVEGYECIYELSNDGLLHSLYTGKYSYGNDNGKGYNIFQLCKEGVRYSIMAHILVYKTFIGPIPEGYDIHHKNHIRKDNRVENLELIEHKKHSLNHINDRVNSFIDKCSKPVLQYTKDGQFVAEYPSIKEAQLQTGIYNISKCCNKKKCKDRNGNYYTVKTAGGFIWEYAA